MQSEGTGREHSSGCPGPCGDGSINGSEVCDGVQLGTRTCPFYGFYTGTLSCNSSCSHVTTGCSGRCGDGILQATYEQCEGTNLNGATCAMFGYYIGTPTCTSGCALSLTGS